LTFYQEKEKCEAADNEIQQDTTVTEYVIYCSVTVFMFAVVNATDGFCSVYFLCYKYDKLCIPPYLSD